MVDQIVAFHEKEYRLKPSVIVSVPGKLDLLGEHGEYGKGSVLSLGTDRRFYIAASKRTDNSLRFYSANLNERKKSTISGLKYKKESRWANYCKGVLAYLQEKGHTFHGMNITLFSEVPVSIGLASSSAMVMATALAVNELFHLKLSPLAMIEAADWSERTFMGIRESFASPMICFHAKPGHLCILDLRDLSVDYIPFPADDLVLLATDSQVTETMGDDEKVEFDSCCRECEDVLGMRPGKMIFGDLSQNDLSGTIDGLSERSRRVCMHLVKENSRIFDFRKSLETGSYDAAGRILFRSHESLRDYLEISCPEFDWLTKRAMETDGVYGSRMIGGGFGGCTITMMSKEGLAEYEARLEEYDRIFGFKASVFPVTPGAGAIVHLSEGDDE